MNYKAQLRDTVGSVPDHGNEVSNWSLSLSAGWWRALPSISKTCLICEAKDNRMRYACKSAQGCPA